MLAIDPFNASRGHVERRLEEKPHGTYARTMDALIAVEEASSAVRSALKINGFQVLNDDRLRILEATIYGYLLAGNPDERGLITAEGFGAAMGGLAAERVRCRAKPGRDFLNDVMNQVMEVWPVQDRPPSGSMVYWRWKRAEGMLPIWQFGYVTYAAGGDLLRIGARNGDTARGDVVSIADIEWRPANRERT